ncbi:SDR family NAD(P)-dependent oxidoreductase [Actinokineospora sp. UTMC 2448]|uniref:SDR family NAD(P)-dependent oxidoreductase n=1 Tax=Actinokineospora sp. UTMC 2448 TaxID=2268449 RepID=UPI002164E4FE|nr:SDR family NAD(P)-dependent oxidoreductase [Actinokineospora sp. UTMC 2448]
MIIRDGTLAARISRSRLAGALMSPRGGVGVEELRGAVEGRTVLITGASYGLGAATARMLADAGATVLMTARTAAALAEVAGGRGHCYPADLSDPAAVGELAARVLAEHGPPDVVVSNAGKSIRRTLAASRFHDFQRTMAVNYLGPVRLLLDLLPAMRARGSGHLVNVSTIGVQVPPGPRWAAYQASKSAFDVFFRSAALEAAADGITASSVYMGLIRTRMSAPTASLANAPGQSADEAAGVLARAIARRPAKISPWWADLAELGAAVSRRPWEAAVRWRPRR